jgi:predicted xylose isomerase-like sugar epimerase
MISSGGALMGILSTHFPIFHRPGEIEMRHLRHAAQVAADALVLIRVNGGTSSDTIDASLEIVRDSQDALKRTEKLLSRDLLYP